MLGLIKVCCLKGNAIICNCNSYKWRKLALALNIYILSVFYIYGSCTCIKKRLKIQFDNSPSLLGFHLQLQMVTHAYFTGHDNHEICTSHFSILPLLSFCFGFFPYSCVKLCIWQLFVWGSYCYTDSYSQRPLP